MAEDANVELFEVAIREMAAKLRRHSSALSEHAATIAAGEKFQEVLRHAVEHHNEFRALSTKEPILAAIPRNVLIGYFLLEGVSPEIAERIVDTSILKKDTAT